MGNKQLKKTNRTGDKYSILFEPVKIGPVVAPNRFYQAPHGCGYGHREPSSMVAIRSIKAEGGWGVISTEQTEIHPSSDMAPSVELRNWDERDLPTLHAVSSEVHKFGALAALELSHSGLNTSNLGTRETALSASGGQSVGFIPAIPAPFQSRAMDKQDIADLRGWHKAAATRGCKAEFDIIYVYASQLLSLPNQFLSKRYNNRNDEYGGSLQGRLRLLRELIEDTLEVANGKHAVAVRLTVDELLSRSDDKHSDLAEVFSLIGEMPDLWDITISGYEADGAGTTRFDMSPNDVEVLPKIKSLTSKPIVSVRFFQSTEDMVDLVETGYLDLIGSARQSIADPFLPNKLRSGRSEEVRTCIKCNICVATDLAGVGVQCTQNPTFGEEWRRGWHPEIMPQKNSNDSVAIIGGGAAGLECARGLGCRGYDVFLYERKPELGGRVAMEAQLHGLELWKAIIDYRLNEISRLTNVSIHTSREIDIQQIEQISADHLVVAMGAHWPKYCFDRRGSQSANIVDDTCIATPYDILSGAKPTGSVLIYDDDHYYLAGLFAEKLCNEGCNVTLATPAAQASIWTHFTMEQGFVQRNLINLGVEILPHKVLESVDRKKVLLGCTFTGSKTEYEFDSTIIVTGKLSNRKLYDELIESNVRGNKPSYKSVSAVGQAEVPGIIAQSVRSGYRFAFEFDNENVPELFNRDIVVPEQSRR